MLYTIVKVPHHTLCPRCNIILYSTDKMQGYTSHKSTDSWKLMIFCFLIFKDINTRSCESRVWGLTIWTYLYISPYVEVKKGSLCNRNIFSVGICHQRHENWLSLLIAQVRFHWYQKQSLLRFSRREYLNQAIFYRNMILNTHWVVQLGYNYHW